MEKSQTILLYVNSYEFLGDICGVFVAVNKLLEEKLKFLLVV